MKSVISLASFFFMMGCPADPQKASSARSSAGAFDEEATVRLDAPTMGSTVQSPFEVSFTLGPTVSTYSLSLGEDDVEGVLLTDDGVGAAEIESEPGDARLTLEGWDADGNLLNSHWVEVNVVPPDGPWVTITTPSDGAEVSNPVQFGVDASSGVDSIEILADDWSLGTVSSGELLSYRFTGTGYARNITAIATTDGVEVASDQIEVMVLDEQPVEESDWNSVMLSLIETYPTDGSYTYDWTDAGHGTTMDIFYDGSVVAEAGPGATCFCCGITFEVYMRTFAQFDEELGGDGLLNGMTIGDVIDFRRDWFVRDLWGDGPGVGFANYGLGEPITDWASLKPGDPVQFWRFSGSGHSVIFIEWVTDTDGTIVGLEYWSTQPSTDGVGYQREYFGTGGSDLDPAHFHASRAWMPHDWLPWE